VVSCSLGDYVRGLFWLPGLVCFGQMETQSSWEHLVQIDTFAAPHYIAVRRMSIQWAASWRRNIPSN
jgi:hypothetical protein